MCVTSLRPLSFAYLFLFLCILGGHHGMPAFTAWHVLFALLRMPLLKYGKLSANAIFFPFHSFLKTSWKAAANFSRFMRAII